MELQSSIWITYKPWLIKGGVLAILAAIGWYGHAHHWAVLGLSSAHSAAPSTSPEVSALKDPNGPLPTSTDPPQAIDQLPTVQFSSADAARKCGIETSTAVRRSLDDFLQVHGVVDYDQNHVAQLSIRVPGVVWRVIKRVGDYVERDEVLAIFDSAEVGQAKANLLEASVVYRLKSESLKRLEELQNVTTGRALYEAKADKELSRAQRFIALQKLGSLGFHLHVEDIESISTDELAEQLQMLGLPATLKTESSSANLIPLVAPFAGVITDCHIVRGESVAPPTPQYVLADVSRMWVNLDVRQEDAALLKLGEQVKFISEVNSRSVVGKLTWIGTDIDSRTRTIRARAEVDNPFMDASETNPCARRLLQAGAFGSAHILLHHNPSAVMIPNDALHWQWEIGREVVFVPSADGKEFTPRVVNKGLVRDGFVEIRDGLLAGDQVAVSGCRVLSSELSEQIQRQSGDNAKGIRDFPEARSSNGH